jgi:uncharacterized protein involved in type VI secretion and phage assembly
MTLLTQQRVLANGYAVRRYFGKHRGRVVNNIDPEGMARIQVQVPDISAQPLINFALPCAPVGGMQNGMVAVPPVGAGVWVEFEQGDPEYPIWTGCYWGSRSEVPRRAVIKPAIDAITFQTKLQNSVIISDMPGTGGIEIKTTTEAKIHVSDVSIKIDNGKGASIELIGPMIKINAATVDINNSALQIT